MAPHRCADALGSNCGTVATNDNWTVSSIATLSSNSYATAISNALSPSNFILTNPEVLKATLESGGENLVKGLKNLLGDILSFPELNDSTIRLMDIDPSRLKTTQLVAERIARAVGAHPTIEATLDRRAASLPNVEFALGLVRRIDLEARSVETDDRRIRYDYLILAPGSASHFFGIPGAAEHALREREGREWARVLRLVWLRRGRRSRPTRTHPPRR